jgi:photosystem II stability/assembly factor-like uncharacterized protein
MRAGLPRSAIYVDGPEGLLSHLPGSPSPVFRSGDGGTSWTKTPFSLRENCQAAVTRTSRSIRPTGRST